MATQNIKGKQIADESITGADIGPDAVGSSEISSTAITGQPELNPAASGDFVLVSDTDNSGNLKKVQIGNLGLGGGSSTSIEDADSNTKIQVEESSDENKIRFDTAGSERMIIDEAGRVGIGRTPISGTLEVNGNTLISSGTLTAESFDVSRNTGGHVNLIRDAQSITSGNALGVIHFAGTEDTGSSFGEGAWIAAYTSESWTVGSAEGADLKFYTQINGNNAGPTERMVIDNTGKVGIGISGPDTLLHIKGPAPAITLQRENNSNDSSNINFEGSSGVVACQIGQVAGTDNELALSTHNGSNLLERVRIDNAGNVGIGTNNPTYALDVAGDIGVNEYIYHNDDTNTYIRFQDDDINLQAGGKSMIKIDEGNGIVTINNSNNDVDFQVMSDNGTALIRTDAANNRVGIGITSPQSLLHLEEVDITEWPMGGSSNELYDDFLLTLRNNTDTLDAFAGIAFDVSTETDSDSIGAAIVATCASTTAGQHDSDLAFATNNSGDDSLTERMRITAAGRIGFGTPDPESGIDSSYAMYANNSDSYCLKLHNDGNSSSRRGLYISCGKDDGTGTNYGVVLADGNGSWQGSIKFTSGTVTYAAFTGDHPAEIPNGHSYDYGTIVCVTSAASTDRSIVYNVTNSTSEMQKSILGCYGGDNGGVEGPPARHSVYSVGDGHVLVCSEGGNIEIGDFICTSNTAGHGMKQANENMTNYTVAKAFEAVDWSQESQSTKLIACTYHAG